MKVLKISLLAIMCLSLTLVLGACGGKSDADIKKDVDAKLTAYPTVKSEIKDGVVTLTGMVEDSTKQKAAETAAKVEGVKTVTNNIQIKPAATPMPMPPAPMGNTNMNANKGKAAGK